eukprot:237071_1
MWGSLALFIKQQQAFFAFVLVEILVYFVVDRYYFNHALTLGLLNLNTLHVNQNHTLSADYTFSSNYTASSNHSNGFNEFYSPSYYRKQINYSNTTYYAYDISIGKLFARYLSPNETKQYGAMMKHDLIQNIFQKKHLSDHKLVMRQLYHLYYDDLHVNSTTVQSNKMVDFFAFINDGYYPNDTNVARVNFYNKKPVEHVLDRSYKGGYSKVNLSNTLYFFPRLFSYTLSADHTSNLPSLEFRFVEIVSVLQHDATRHILLNNLKPNLLWAGEFYFVYDHKFKKYILIMDNSSGHFRPNIQHQPKYLERLLLQSLFPHYNRSKKQKYRPLKMIGHEDRLWHGMKKVLFPVNHDIHVRDHQKMVDRKKKKRQYILMYLGKKPCSWLMKQSVVKMHKSTKFNRTLEESEQYMYQKLHKLHIECDRNATSSGWNHMTQAQEEQLYKLLTKLRT